MNHATTEKALWEKIADNLPARDPQTEWYSIEDIAPLLGIKPRILRSHCRDLWPNHDGYAHWRLDHSQAIRLIRRVCWAGRKVPGSPYRQAAATARPISSAA